MRKIGGKIISLVLCVLMACSFMSLVGCGGKKGKNDFWFVYFKGGYGSEWATELAAKFQAEHPGINVVPTANSQLIDDVPNYMENGCDYDLIFCHDVAWEDFVYPEWIYCLDDLYNTTVSEGVTFKDRIWDEDVLDSCSYVGRDGQNHYYKVPWTIGTAGMAYNMTIMDRVDAFLASPKGQTYLATAKGGNAIYANNTARRWNRKAPETFYDLMQYCYDIVEAKLLVNEGDTQSKLIRPFTWSGKSEEWQWDYVVFDWWGQLAGPETVNTFKNFGNVDEHFNLDWDSVKDPDINVYNADKAAVVRNSDGTVDKGASTYVGWKEFKQAYSLWYNLIVSDKSWSLDTIASYGKNENESAFAFGQAAMTPAACWIEYEAKEFLEDSEQEVSLMASPIVSHVRFDESGNVIPKYQTAQYDAAADREIDAIHATAEDVAAEKNTIRKIGDEYYNRVSFTTSFGDSVMIPSSATQKELAMEFLLFMQREENAKLFTRLSGGTVLPYKYDYASSFIENGENKATAWQQSVFEINANSTKFNNYTKHPMMRNTQLKKTSRMEAMWPQNEYYYYKAWAGNTNPAYKPDTLFNSIYGSLSPLWEQWKNAYKNNY